MSFADFAFSMQMRDTIKKIAGEVVEQKRPPFRYGQIVEIDFIRERCRVILTGDTEPVYVNLGALQPRDVGQKVRIEGRGTDRFIADITGPTASRSGATLLDEIDLRGSTYDDHYLHVPGAMQGVFTKYVIDMSAGTAQATSTNRIRPIVIRINGNANSEYRSSANAVSNGSVIESWGENVTSFPRTGFMSLFEGSLTTEFVPISLGDTSFMSWHSHGWGNRSSSTGNFTVTAGGRWSGQRQPISSFRLLSNASSVEWTGSSRAQLWGFR